MLEDETDDYVPAKLSDPLQVRRRRRDAHGVLKMYTYKRVSTQKGLGAANTTEHNRIYPSTGDT